MRRFVGAVVLVIGVGLIALDTIGAVRSLWLARSIPDRLRFPLLLLLAIGAFLTCVGWRLVRTRPPRSGSTLSRPAWVVLGCLFTALTIWFAVVAPLNSDLVVPLGSSALFAVACFGVAFRPKAADSG